MLEKKAIGGGGGGGGRGLTSLNNAHNTKIVYRQIACPLLSLPYYFAEHFSWGYLNS